MLTGGGFKKKKAFVGFLSLASLMVKDIDILSEQRKAVNTNLEAEMKPIRVQL